MPYHATMTGVTWYGTRTCISRCSTSSNVQTTDRVGCGVGSNGGIHDSLRLQTVRHILTIKRTQAIGRHIDQQVYDHLVRTERTRISDTWVNTTSVLCSTGSWTISGDREDPCFAGVSRRCSSSFSLHKEWVPTRRECQTSPPGPWKMVRKDGTLVALFKLSEDGLHVRRVQRNRLQEAVQSQKSTVPWPEAVPLGRTPDSFDARVARRRYCVRPPPPYS